MTSTIEVSRSRLQQNVAQIQRALRQAVAPSHSAPALMAVIKANGYGHSATLCAPILAAAGLPWLGVTDAEEGAAVRTALGSGSPALLVMSGPPGDDPGARAAAALAIQHHLTPVVWTPAQLPPLAAAAGPGSHPIHLEIDTGMSRQGTPPGHPLHQFLQALAHSPNLRLDGIFTHLASAERTDAIQTTHQLKAFEAAVRTTAAAGHTPAWLHIGNASTIDNAFPAASPTILHLQTLAQSIAANALIRCGLALYGLSLSLEPFALEATGGGHPEHTRLQGSLHPVATWRTTITAITEVAAGTSIGYGAAFTTPRAMRLALLPVGYADGLRRELSSTTAEPGGWALIAGHRAPIAGRISMNLTTVDITNIYPPPCPGAPVTLLGAGISAEDHARLAHTIPYEILCGLRGNPIMTD